MRPEPHHMHILLKPRVANLSGVVNAGETILAPIGEYILKVDIVPNYVEVGASTKYGGAVDNIIKDNVETDKQMIQIF